MSYQLVEKNKLVDINDNIVIALIDIAALQENELSIHNRNVEFNCIKERLEKALSALK